MLAYATVGTNKLEAAGQFFDVILGELDGCRIMENDRSVVWRSPDGHAFGLMKPFDKKDASVGNGAMLALACTSPEQIDSLYAKVLELGGTDDGEPGYRKPGMYMAYWRDLDGNKFCFMHMDMEKMG